MGGVWCFSCRSFFLVDGRGGRDMRYGLDNGGPQGWSGGKSVGFAMRCSMLGSEIDLCHAR